MKYDNVPIRSIDNRISRKTLSTIPTTRHKRRIFLEDTLSSLVDIPIPCPALNGTVRLIPKSAGETACWASLSRKSTVCALNVIPIIKNATLVTGPIDPKNNRQIKEFKFKHKYILYTHVKYYGIARLVIGERGKGNFIQYCVTSLSIKETP